MNIIVVGCGKVGSRLACVLNRIGHDVVIVDKDEEKFDRLDDDYNGVTVHGVPIDQDVLKEAGIESCDGLAAVTEDDNVNIMVSQVAREIFKVEHVVARIYDPAREDVFSHFGLETICPTKFSVDALCSALTLEEPEHFISIGNESIVMDTVPIPHKYVGKIVGKIDLDGYETVFGIKHDDGTISLGESKDVVLKGGDSLILCRHVG